MQVADLESRPNRDELLDLVRKLEADHYLVRRATPMNSRTSPAPGVGVPAATVTTVDASGGERPPVMPFTPSREVAASAAGAAEVAARTVGREEILTRLEQRLRSAATSRNRPHTLLVGPWGSGKTHLVEVALHRMRQNAAVADQLAVVRLPEDAIRVTRYQDLLDLAAGQLRGDPASSGPAAVAGATAAGLPRRPAEDVDALPAEPLAGRAGRAPATGGSVSEQDIRELLNGRVLLLVIDNLDRVFTAIGVRGQRQFCAAGWRRPVT